MVLSTILVEAALENEQVDKALAAMGIAQNLQKRRMSLWRETWIKVCANGLGPSGTAADSGGSLEDEGKILGEPPDQVHAGPVLESEGALRSNHKAHCCARALFQKISSLEACRKNWRDGSLQ